MANETILVVDEDQKIQKVLQVSLKKAGYRVLLSDSVDEASKLVKSEHPELIICETRFLEGDGFAFLGDLKSGNHKDIPFIFLTEERALPQKMKGFELGADDYLTKPFYLKEITTRADLLIQRHSDDLISEDAENEFSGHLSHIGVIDLLQKIEAEKTSGSIQIERNEHHASIYFKEGNIFDAFCGKLSGEDAIYRLFFWPEGEFIMRYHDIGKRKDRIPKDCTELLIKGMDKLSQYQEISSQIQLDAIYDLDFDLVARVRSKLPTTVAEIFRLFNGERSVRDVIDASPIEDVTAIQIVKRVIDEGLVIQTSRSEASTSPNLETWLEDDQDDFLAENTSLTFQVKPDDVEEEKEERVDRKTERLLDAQLRRTTDQQHSIKTSPLKSIAEIEHQEEKRRAVEAQHLSGQHQAVTKNTLKEYQTDPKLPEEDRPKTTEAKRKRRSTPIRSQAHVSATDLEIEMSEIEEDEATTAEIPNAADAYASMQEAHVAKQHLSEDDTFEDSEPIEEEEENEERIFESGEVPSTERPTAEIERITRTESGPFVSVSDPEISEVEEDEEDLSEESEELEEDEKNHTPFYSEAIETEEEGQPLVARNAIDGQMVSASFDIGASEEKPASQKEDDSKEVESPNPIDDFFNTEPDESLAEEAPRSNYWIPIVLGLVVLIGGFAIYSGSDTKSHKKEMPKVVEKEKEKEPKVDLVEVKKVDPALEAMKKANAQTQTMGNDGAINIEANALALAINLNETKEENLELDSAAEKEALAAKEKEALAAKEKEALAAKEKELSPKEKEAQAKKENEALAAKEKAKEAAAKTEQEKEKDASNATFKKRLKIAKKLVKRRKWSKALVELRKLSSEKSGSAQVAYLHGRAAFGSRSNSEAIKHFVRAKKLGYKSASMMLDLAAAYQLDGNRAKAKSAYEGFLKIQPSGQRADEVRSILKNQF